MRRNIVTMIAAMLFTISTANAAVYKFTFESFDSELTAAGQFSVNASGQVTNVSGAISGLANQTMSAVVPNPNFSSPAYSPDGRSSTTTNITPRECPSTSTACCS
jgi:hypothetical protein